MPKLVFYGCSTLVGQVLGSKSCRAWLEDPNDPSWDPLNLVDIDLSKAPGQIAPDSWEQLVQVDDHTDQFGGTTIGGSFPGGVYEGAVYLIARLWHANKSKIFWPPVLPVAGNRPAQDHEFQSLIYRDGSSPKRRYHGFHAKVVQLPGNNRAVLDIFEAGGNVPKISGAEIAFMDPDECDPPANDHTRIGGVGEAAAVFLSWKKAKLLGLRMPKLPPSDGGGRFIVPDVSNGMPPAPEAPAAAMAHAKHEHPPGPSVARRNVVSTEDDNQLDAIRENIECEFLADAPRGLAKALSPETGPREILDLVGHSTPGDCHLQLGTWTVSWSDPSVRQFFQGAGKDLLKALGVKALRLIGCSTARTPAGWSTIVKIADALRDANIEVFGTKVLVYASDFTRAGYEGGNLVGSRDTDYAPSGSRQPFPIDELPRMVSRVGRPLDPSDFRAASLESLPSVRCRRVIMPTDWNKRMSEFVGDSIPWELPSLLTTPSLELLLPCESQCGTWRRMQILFDYQLIRVYDATDRALIYRVESPDALCKALNLPRSQ